MFILKTQKNGDTTRAQSFSHTDRILSLSSLFFSADQPYPLSDWHYPHSKKQAFEGAYDLPLISLLLGSGLKVKNLKERLLFTQHGPQLRFGVSYYERLS